MGVETDVGQGDVPAQLGEGVGGVRDRVGGHEMLLETRLDRGFDLGDRVHVALDLFADWRSCAALTLSLARRNATDADWEDAVGFPAPGRVLRAQVGFAF